MRVERRSHEEIIQWSEAICEWIWKAPLGEWWHIERRNRIDLSRSVDDERS